MSMRSLYSLALGLLTLLSIAGCKKSSEVVYEPTSDGVAYLRVDAAGVTFPVGGTRAQSEEPTINDDAEDFEDYVRELAVLVYEARGEEKLIYSHFTTLPNFMLEIPAKQGEKYHFCFIANYPESWHNTLKGIQSYTELKTLLQSMRDFKTLYEGATAANGYLPMARIYESQELPAEKGSPVSPVPFIPKKVQPKALSPVSSATRFSAHETALTYANTIMMVRSSAKVTVKTVGGDTPKIELVNVPTQHSYMESAAKPSSYTTLTMSAGNTEQSSINSLYVPESLLGNASTTTLGWNTTNDSAIGNVMYVQLTTKSGVVYRLPLFTDESGTASTDTMHDYLHYARGEVAGYTTNYSVLRNNHYIISVTLNDDSRVIEVSYEVLPWVLMRSEYNFTNPKYTIEVTTPSGADFKIKNYLHLQEEATFKFKIHEPKGGIWVASVTNAKYFTLVYDIKEQPVISGFVDGKEHEFKLKPLYPYNGFPQYTQVYITVNGQEIYLGGDDNRFVRDYTKHGRWKFAQVDSNL